MKRGRKGTGAGRGVMMVIKVEVFTLTDFFSIIGFLMLCDGVGNLALVDSQ